MDSLKGNNSHHSDAEHRAEALQALRAAVLGSMDRREAAFEAVLPARRGAAGCKRSSRAEHALWFAAAMVGLAICLGHLADLNWAFAVGLGLVGAGVAAGQRYAQFSRLRGSVVALAAGATLAAGVALRFTG